MPHPDPAPDADAWYLLIHQLPPRPLYLRAKIRRQLARVGALAIKNSVYVLPARDDCLEDLQWIAQEAVAGGGEACICRAAFAGGLSAAQLADRFRDQAAARYEPMKAELESVLQKVRQSRGATPEHIGARLMKLRKQLREIGRTDFFGSTAGREVQTMMKAIEEAQARHTSRRQRSPGRTSRGDLVGRIWVTRRDPKIDRLATAWLIRRFVDPAARFRFVDPTGGAVRAGELTFDMVGAAFGHEGDRCTFETILARLGLADPALRQISEVVHDIDLKDAKFGRPEAAGVQQMIRGLRRTYDDSDARIAAAIPAFDALYASFGGRRASLPSARRAQPRRARR
jgi:hypothetical protein